MRSWPMTTSRLVLGTRAITRYLLHNHQQVILFTPRIIIVLDIAKAGLELEHLV
jgi:hypothetical protein